MEPNTPAWAETIHLLAERWKDAGILLPAFPLLARGEPITVEAMSQVSGRSNQAVERALERGRCERDAHGRVSDLFGLTLSPTMHRLEIDRKILFSCCALWAHVIPRFVESLVEVESVDPRTRELVRLKIGPEGVVSVGPETAVATLARASRAEIDSDIGEAFCGQVNHFGSEASAREFVGQNPLALVVTLNDVQTAAEQMIGEIMRATEN